MMQGSSQVSSYEFSVTELSSKIKDLLEGNLGYVRVRGEISGLKIAASGHGYFNLKENLAVLACTCWRPALGKLKFKLEDGMNVVVVGKITAYAGQSKYQMSVEQIDPAGLGAMMQILNERKAKLQAEGLFDEGRKRPLPFLPKTIGVVTSISGAVIRDIIHRIANRCPTRVIIWPVSVQGEGAADEIAQAVSGFNLLVNSDRPDVIIVARGGGSIEDLWSFNEEVVVRSVANSVIPVISAVGHETDFTLVDFAADKRAPTPTAAAEFAVPVLDELQYTISQRYSFLANAVSRIVRTQLQTLENYNHILKYKSKDIFSYAQNLDEIGFRLSDIMYRLLEKRSEKLESLPITRIDPSKILEYKYAYFGIHADSLSSIQEDILKSLEQKLTLQSELLESLDYQKVLKRGFALARKSDGGFVSSAKEAINSDALQLQFQDGIVKVTPSIVNSV